LFLYPLSRNRELRSGIVHRLDKETSGILLIAKSKDVFDELQSQFKERKVNKTYLALVHGKVEPKEGEIKTPVGRLPWNRERFGVLPGGKIAETEYEVLNYFRKGNDQYSYIEFKPKTGRTHQLRIHAKYLGHPIVSDNLYAGRKTVRKDRLWCPRLFLHASAITFTHPFFKKKVVYKSQLPHDLTESLNSLVKVGGIS